MRKKNRKKFLRLTVSLSNSESRIDELETINSGSRERVRNLEQMLTDRAQEYEEALKAAASLHAGVQRSYLDYVRALAARNWVGVSADTISAGMRDKLARLVNPETSPLIEPSARFVTTHYVNELRKHNAGLESKVIDLERRVAGLIEPKHTNANTLNETAARRRVIDLSGEITATKRAHMEETAKLNSRIHELSSLLRALDSVNNLKGKPLAIRAWLAAEFVKNTGKQARLEHLSYADLQPAVLLAASMGLGESFGSEEKGLVTITRRYHDVTFFILSGDNPFTLVTNTVDLPKQYAYEDLQPFTLDSDTAQDTF